MTMNNATAEWRGDLKGGNGKVELGQGAFSGQYSFKSRFEGEKGTNPEELIAAAHAACFSMAFSHGLAEAGFPVTALKTEARVTLDKTEGGFGITQIDLFSEAEVPGIDEAKFQELGEVAKKGCPVSKALAGVKTINLTAILKK
ncbi:MAG: peroxiredoxin [Alphaproteobacteria bacterium]|nr:peroxiredoxin [Alphaproteobacteria bacterium]